MIFVMALLGAITRLTESGLSITDWNPIMGALPPQGEQAWQQAFASYQEIPQFKLLHQGMTLQEFKGIYFWEWIHRLWGRLIGVVFAIPLILFLIQKKINHRMGMKFAIIFVLGGLQGFIGWFMVQSGLAIRTSVSPYRLALHLGFALAIYAVLLWAAFDGMPSQGATQKKVSPSVLYHGGVALLFLIITMVWGAFTAGLHAGEVYNTWPLMDGELIPSASTTLQPVWHNFFENTGLVQCIHRWLGPTTMVLLLAWIARCWAYVQNKKGLVALGLMAIVQVGLGIATVLSHAAIPVAVIHQAGALTLLSLVLLNVQRFSDKTTANR